MGPKSRHQYQIEITDLVIAFRGRKVLEVPHFSLVQGEKILLTGPSGCGKSIFLKVLLGILHEPSVASGRFLLRQAPDSGPAEAVSYAEYVHQSFLREKASVVFQDAINSLHPYRTIAHQCPPALDSGARDKYLEFKLDPDYFSHRLPRELSGGECQRLSLLFPYFSTERDLLVMDEPLTDIDWISRKNIEACLERFLRDPKCSVVMVTHQPHWLPEIQHYAVRDGVMTQQSSRRNEKTSSRRPAAPPKPQEVSPLLQIRLQKTYSFPGNRGFLLRPFSLELAQGESLGLIGESGCGKSTLLRIAAGLFPQSHYRTHFRVGLTDRGGTTVPLMNLPRADRYRRLQLVQQNTTGSLITNETVGGNLKWIRRLKGIDAAQFTTTASRWGEKLHLFSHPSELAARQLAQLSVGMLRRYLLLRAFLLLDIYGNDQSPKLLLLDEISRGLDAENVESLVRALAEFAREHHVSIIAVSHDIEFIRASCNGFRMMFRGMLLPQHFEAEALDEAEDNAQIQSLLNPYYYDFLARQDPRPQTTTGTHGCGCFYAHYFKCRNLGVEGCQHEAFIASERIDICS